MNQAKTCPSCGAEIPDDSNCIDLYYELSLYTLAHRDPEFIHQYIVDAYAAQHPQQHAKSVGITPALIGLYLFVEHNYTGKEVQNAHVELGNKMKNWPPFSTPNQRATINVSEVLKTSPGETRDSAIRNWAKAVWQTWQSQKPIIENKLKSLVFKI